MEDPSQFRGKIEESSTLELTGKIMVVAIIVLSIVVVFVFLLHLYSKWFWNHRQQGNNNNTTRAANVASILRKGLDPSLLKTLPVISFNPIDFKDGLECAVCLCDVTEGEQTRLLPKCNHGFHVECIDMWFQSHSTCPLCRNPVSKISSESSTVETESVEESSVSPIEVPIFPTNVLFWGNETQVSTLGPCLDESNLQGPTSSQSACPSSSSAAAAAAAAASTSDRPCVSLVIDIPRQISEEEEYKSPISTRLRSLRRLLSRDRMAYPFSPRVVDVEQGGGRGQS